jgi:hypothetical protein
MKEAERLFKIFGRNFPMGTILFEEGQACTAEESLCDHRKINPRARMDRREGVAVFHEERRATFLEIR